MEAPGLGVILELQLWPVSQPQQHQIEATFATYTTVTLDPLPTEGGQGSYLYPYKQCRVLNLPSWNRNS